MAIVIAILAVFCCRRAREPVSVEDPPRPPAPIETSPDGGRAHVSLTEDDPVGGAAVTPEVKRGDAEEKMEKIETPPHPATKTTHYSPSEPFGGERVAVKSDPVEPFGEAARTSEQYKIALRIFGHIDTDESGKIDLQELAAFSRKLLADSDLIVQHAGELLVESQMMRDTQDTATTLQQFVAWIKSACAAGEERAIRVMLALVEDEEKASSATLIARLRTGK